MRGISSDGKYIAYERWTGNNGARRTYILAADEKSEVPLLAGASASRSPVWTPDGSRIVFVSDRSGSPGLWSVRIAEGKPTGEPELLVPGFDADLMRFSRDGSLFFDQSVNTNDIYLAGLDPATGKLASEPRRINQLVGNSWGRVAWLPDGKSLSFWNKAPVSALVEHTLATGEEREIWGGKSGRPGSAYTGWFPDGRTLMAVNGNGQNNGPNMPFRRMDSSTGEVKASWTVPSLPAGSSAPIYSPDLMTMFFTQKVETIPCEGKRCTFATIARELETGRDREIFRIKTYAVRNRSISPDGKQLAFVVSDGLATAVMIAPAAGGQPRDMYKGTEDVGFTGITWTQDASHVLALRRTPTGGEVWSISVKDGSVEKSPYRMHPSETPAVSPDGTQIVFVGRENKSEVWVITGLLPPSSTR